MRRDDDIVLHEPFKNLLSKASSGPAARQNKAVVGKKNKIWQTERWKWESNYSQTHEVNEGALVMCGCGDGHNSFKLS